MTTEPAHSKFSASSSHRWMHCPGSMALESVLPDTTSSYADEGSAAHWVASEVLSGKLTLAKAVGQEWWEAGAAKPVLITEDMCDHVQTYIDTVLTYGGELMVEQRVDISRMIGQPDTFGTSDAIIFSLSITSLPGPVRAQRVVKKIAKPSAKSITHQKWMVKSEILSRTLVISGS